MVEDLYYKSKHYNVQFRVGGLVNRVAGLKTRRERVMIRDLYYRPLGAPLYNVHFKDGRLANRVTERALCGLRPVDIDWVWDVEHRRRATLDEIQKLCKLSSES